MQKIFSSMIAATGRQLKQSVKVFHNFMLYRRLPAAHRESLMPETVEDRTICPSRLEQSFKARAAEPGRKMIGQTKRAAEETTSYPTYCPVSKRTAEGAYIRHKSRKSC